LLENHKVDSTVNRLKTQQYQHTPLVPNVQL